MERSPHSEMNAPVETNPAVDWSDIAGWDRYLQTKGSDGPFRVPTVIGAKGWQSVRFLSFVRKHGGRVWFPGCGIDPGPRFYAYVGSTVLATDFSPVAVRVQQGFAALAPEVMFGDWLSFVKSNAPFEKCGRFDVAEHDFTTGPPGWDLRCRDQLPCIPRPITFCYDRSGQTLFRRSPPGWCRNDRYD